MSIELNHKLISLFTEVKNNNFKKTNIEIELSRSNCIEAISSIMVLIGEDVIMISYDYKHPKYNHPKYNYYKYELFSCPSNDISNFIKDAVNSDGIFRITSLNTLESCLICITTTEDFDNLCELTFQVGNNVGKILKFLENKYFNVNHYVVEQG